MNFLRKYLLVASAGLLLLISCDDDVSVDNFLSGDLDFSNYVALGNSLTSGYADGTLYLDAQTNSYPALMAKQFANVGGGEFKQPLVSDNLGGLVLAGTKIADTKLVLTADGPVSIDGTPSTEVGASIASGGPYNNLGVPGAKASHLLSPTYGSIAGLATMPRTANPYYVRFSKPDQSLIDAAVEQKPTFFTLWIGNNDVLGYATSGGEGDVITPQDDFTTYFSALLTKITADGAEGMVANIPNVTDIPFFNTVPANAIPLDAAKAGQANAAYETYNAGLDQFVAAEVITQAEADKRKIVFTEGANYPVIIDPNLTQLQDGQGEPIPSLRQLKAGELLTLTARSVLGTIADPNNPASVIGIGAPLGSEYSLISEELSKISNAISGYNATISQVAASKNIPVADMNGVFANISDSGLLWNGSNYSVSYATGGLFSLDGVHPTQKGYAFIANKFIQEINKNYGSNVPRLNIDDYVGVVLP